MKKWLSSFGHACRGIALFVRTERNARIEIFISVIVIGLSIWLNLPVLDFAIILFCIGAVLVAEAFNTAVERMADFQTREIHSEIKKIKDISAGAVLITAIVSVIVGLLIFGPAIMEKLNLI